MIRFLLKERITDKDFKEDHRITIDEITKDAGISRLTFFPILNTKGYKTSTNSLDKLYKFFDCKLGELAEYIKD